MNGAVRKSVIENAATRAPVTMLWTVTNMLYLVGKYLELDIVKVYGSEEAVAAIEEARDEI